MLVTHTWVDLEHAFLDFSWLCAHLGVNGYVNGRSMARLPLQWRIIMLVVWLLWCVDRSGASSRLFTISILTPSMLEHHHHLRDADTASSLHHFHFQLSLFYSSSLISSFWLYSLSSETHRSPVDPQQRWPTVDNGKHTNYTYVGTRPCFIHVDEPLFVIFKLFKLQVELEDREKEWSFFFLRKIDVSNSFDATGGCTVSARGPLKTIAVFCLLFFCSSFFAANIELIRLLVLSHSAQTNRHRRQRTQAEESSAVQKKS